MISQGHQQSSEAGHERKDVDVMSLLMIVPLLVMMIGICFLVCWGALRLFNRDEAVRSTRPSAPPAPRAELRSQAGLIVYPGQEWAKVRASEKEHLESYGWIDRTKGVVRIPVRRAMQILAQRGLPEVGAGQTRLQLMQARPLADRQPNEPTPSSSPEVAP
ncbi:MAG: hypothetical protein ACR2G0_12810 [Chthoniobacterales bacterium]